MSRAKCALFFCWTNEAQKKKSDSIVSLSRRKHTQVCMQKKNWRKLDNGNGEMVCADVLLLCKPLKSSTFAQIIMHKLAQGLWATFVACNACKLIMRNVFITPEAIIRSSQHSKSAFQCVYWPIVYLKNPKMQKCIRMLLENHSKCPIWILAFSTKFCPTKTDLSGNTVWPQASGFQKLVKMDHSWHF